MDIIITALVGAFLTLLCCGGVIIVGYLRQPNGFAMLRNAAREIAGGWLLAATLYLERGGDIHESMQIRLFDAG